jgi:histidine triad (HIT) family protein
LPDAEPDCLFCRIAGGEAAAVTVLEQPHAVAFLDNRPLFPGHCLVVPRAHRETLSDLSPAEVGPYFETVQLLARAVPAAMGAQGTFVAMNNVVSQSVPHFHVHVVPRVRKDGLRGFFWPRTKYESERQAEEVADRVRAALGDLT